MRPSSSLTSRAQLHEQASCAVNGDTLTLSSGFQEEWLQVLRSSSLLARSGIQEVRRQLQGEHSGGNNINTTSDVTLTGVSTAPAFSAESEYADHSTSGKEYSDADVSESRYPSG